MRLLVRWLISALSLLAAAYFVPGITILGQNGWLTVLVMALVLGFVNAIIRPILALLSCPLVLLTLGLFTLVINALMLLLAAWLSNNVFGTGFLIDGFWPAFWGSIVMTVVSWFISIFIHDGGEERRSERRR